MKGLVKAMIIGAIIIGIGVAVLLIGLGLNGWKMPNSNVSFAMESFTETDENTAVKIEIRAGKLKTEFYDGDKITVEYGVADGYTSEMSEYNGTLIVKAPTRKWYNWVFFRTDIPETVIKIPQNRIIDLNVKMNAGTVNLADGDYQSVDIEMHAGTLKTNNTACIGDFKCAISAGTVSFGTLSCNNFKANLSAGTLGVNSLTADVSSVKISAGSVNLSYTGAKAEYTITKKISAGSCNVDAQTGTTDKSIDIKVSAGGANLSFNS